MALSRAQPATYTSETSRKARHHTRMDDWIRACLGTEYGACLGTEYGMMKLMPKPSPEATLARGQHGG